MKAPYFDTNNLKGPYGSYEWMESFLTEKTRCCKDIENRITRIRGEISSLKDKLIELETRSKTTCGLFATIGSWWKMRTLFRDLKWREDVLIELCNARIQRTLTW
jgi:hypothetical protein